MTNPADPTADFTRTAAALVAANDRWAWLRGILASLWDHGRPCCGCCR